jgi:5-methylcytosine-specific restriction protein A
MAEITKEMTHLAYEFSKKIYTKKISKSEGIKALKSIGLSEGSASDFTKNYAYLMKGEPYARTMNHYATDYFLTKIQEDGSDKDFENALKSTIGHIEYYEKASNANVVGRREVYEKHYQNFINRDKIIYPDEAKLDENEIYFEGSIKIVQVNIYERNVAARQKCIEYYGYKCQICDFDFFKKYGQIGREFIHVHHKIELSSIRENYIVNPIEDLIPVCPNCHSMLHKKQPAYTIAELKEIINSK